MEGGRKEGREREAILETRRMRGGRMGREKGSDDSREKGRQEGGEMGRDERRE
jgi:hypothetical protein